MYIMHTIFVTSDLKIDSRSVSWRSNFFLIINLNRKATWKCPAFEFKFHRCRFSFERNACKFQLKLIKVKLHCKEFWARARASGVVASFNVKPRKNICCIKLCGPWKLSWWKSSVKRNRNWKILNLPAIQLRLCSSFNCNWIIGLNKNRWKNVKSDAAFNDFQRF